MRLRDCFSLEDKESLSISCGEAGLLSQADFLRRVHAYRDVLRPLVALRWGLFVEDAFEFACALFALQLEEREVAILPHAQAGFLREMDPLLDGFILNEVVELHCPVLRPEEIFTGDVGESIALGTFSMPLSFYTSGSTGRPCRVSKRWGQLVAEVAALETLFGPRLADCLFFSTVSHQHIYGFLFRFLWPLLTGRMFWLQSILFPNELQKQMEPLRKVVLISCPAHLQRMPELMDMDVLRERCAFVFSSGGLLAVEYAHRFERDVGEPPVEVFGSTETGGVAYRQQWLAEEDVPWMPLPDVRFALEGLEDLLKVRSPFVSADCVNEEGWVVMGDRVEVLPSGAFHLRGRVDRIVKIEQKRVSLNAVEETLCESPLVASCAALVVPEKGAYHRTFLGVVFVLSKEGEAFYDSFSMRRLTKALKDGLVEHFERVTLPRRWLAVKALPENAQGKCTKEELVKLFEDKQEARLLSEEIRWPEVLEEQVESEYLRLSCRVPEALCFFDGHFDEQAIVPGVVQLHWAMHYAEQFFGIVSDVDMMQAVKFQNILFPKDAFVLELWYDVSVPKVRFSLRQDEKAFSSGSMVLSV